MIKLINFEFKKIYYKTTTWILLVLSAAIAVLGLFYKISDTPWINDASSIYSMCEASLIRETAFGLILLSIIVPLFSSLINSDTYYQEYKNNTIAIIITKYGRNNYYISKAIVVLLTSFIISILPFVINQLLCQMLFPAHIIEVSGGYYKANNFASELSKIPYPYLYYNNPLLYNYLHILFVGIFGALMGLISYVFSLFYKNTNTLVVISFSTVICFIIVLFAVSVNIKNIVIIYYLLALPTISSVNITIFYLMLVGLFFASTLALAYKLIQNKDLIK